MCMCVKGGGGGGIAGPSEVLAFLILFTRLPNILSAASFSFSFVLTQYYLALCHLHTLKISDAFNFAHFILRG